MEEESYITIRTGDGVHVKQWTKRELLNELNEDGSGYSATDALDRIALDSDVMEWGECLLIIKGRVVAPFDKEVTVEVGIE